MNHTQLKEMFVATFGGDTSDIRLFMSPGRVNMIGEHIDYNGGKVFPAALSLATTIAFRKRNDAIIRLKATDLDILVEASTENLNDYRELNWGNYQLGVAYFMQQEGFSVTGCGLLYDDTVPHGGGLSSSAAIEVATALMFATISNEEKGITTPVDMVQMALIAQKTECEYCNVTCGIMDQFASAMGKKDNAILLDCKTLEYKHIPLKLDGYKIVLANSNKKRSLAHSKYNERVAECGQALEILKTALPNITCLADVSASDFEANKHLIKDEIILKRAAHVITECDRTIKSVEALQKNDLLAFGDYMNGSHDSLRDDYEVTGLELDTLVSESRKIAGCIGSRMTGAGFGGCTVSIVKDESIAEFIEKVGANYKKITDLTADFYISEISDGGHEIIE
jgi:galactokinase